MLKGHIGKLLFVDLTRGTIKEESTSENLCRDFMGGYGLGARIIYERQKGKLDALAPGAMLGFLTGPLTATPTMSSGRFVVVGKSPLTLTWGDANCGGFWGPYLKFAGFDGVFITGASKKPVYILIENGKAELRDASHLWGKDCLDTEDALKSVHGQEAQVACIGPSGEQKSLLACIINDYGRAAGRSGMGAVMGAKMLKAIVANGTMKVPMADEARAKQLRKEYMAKMTDWGKRVSKYGTANQTESSAMSGDSPVKNWMGAGQTDFPNAIKISDESVIAEQQRKYGCWQCPIACGGHMKSKEGRARICHKPEYETLCMSGTLCLNDDLESIIRFNDICNAYGFDTISAGSAAGFAIECYQSGILSKEDLGGLEMTWGNGDAIVELAKKIAHREGIGALLADGIWRAAKKIGKGAEALAVHVQGQEVPAHDPRLFPALAVTYRMDATPGRHTQGGRSWIMGNDWIKDEREEKYDFTNTGDVQAKTMNMMHTVNSAGICMFAYLAYPTQFVPDFLTAVTGEKYDIQKCLEVGERVANMRHLFNLREGMNPLNFEFNERIMGRPCVAEGPVAGKEIDDKLLITDYLKAMGWDTKTTQPTANKLKELGLAELVTMD